MRIPAICFQKRRAERKAARSATNPCLLFTALCVAQGALLETLQRGCIILYTAMQLSKNAFDELCNLRHGCVQRRSLYVRRSESHSHNLHVCEINFRRSLASIYFTAQRRLMHPEKERERWNCYIGDSSRVMGVAKRKHGCGIESTPSAPASAAN